MTPDLITREAPAKPARTAAGEAAALRVFVFCRALPEGGEDSMPVALANGLAAEGHPVWFAAAEGPQRSRLDRRVVYLLTDHARQAPVKVAHELSRYLRHHRPDVIHSFGVRCALIATIAVKASHASCLRVMTHDEPVTRRTRRWIAARLVRNCADHYVATEAVRKAELNNWGVSVDRITLLDPSDVGTTAARALSSFYQSLLAARAATP